MPELRTVEYRKNAHVFVLRYQEGEQARALSAIADWASDHEVEFDWLDATAMTLRLGLRDALTRAES